jgi:hypothetical protein
MQELSNFIAASSHHLKPLMREVSQFTFMRFHPRVDSGIPLHSAVKSQQFRSHRRSLSAFERNPALAGRSDVATLPISRC